MPFRERFRSIKDDPAIFVVGLIAGAFGAGIGALIALSSWVETRIEESKYLRSQLKALESRQLLPGPKGDAGPSGPKGDPSTTVEVPSGAVIAFDIRNGCPNGWVRFESAVNRSIIGATEGTYFDDKPTGGNLYTMDYAPFAPSDPKNTFEPYKGRQPNFIPGQPVVDTKKETSFGAIFGSTIALHYCRKN